MLILKSPRKYALLCVLTLCFLTPCLAGSEMFSGNTTSFIPIIPSDKDFPRRSAAPEFFHFPQVSNKYISPDTSPGEGDYTLLTFSAKQAVNYSVNISAAYDLFPEDEIFIGAVYGAYLMANGTWLIAAQPGSLVTGERTNIFLGCGQNTSTFSWKPLGLANSTGGIAVAGNGSHICVVYLEKFLTDEGDEKDWPIRWVKYFSSTNYGETWENGTIWDCSAWDTTKFSGISMDVTSGGYFECMWGFANSSSQPFKCGTIWETRKYGSGAWSNAQNLTAFANTGVWATAPQVMFNHITNVLYALITYHYRLMKLSFMHLKTVQRRIGQARGHWRRVSPKTCPHEFSVQSMM